LLSMNASSSIGFGFGVGVIVSLLLVDGWAFVFQDEVQDVFDIFASVFVLELHEQDCFLINHDICCPEQNFVF